MSNDHADTVDDIDFTDVKRVIFRGTWITQIWNGDRFIWPATWEDVWRDEF